MDLFFSTLNVFFKGLFTPFSRLDPIWGIVWISFLTGIVMLFIFRFTSNQRGIKKAKTKVGAYILEMRLFNHDLIKMIKALVRTLGANFVYLRYMIVPMVVITLPVVMILIQVGYLYDYRPVLPGEKLIVKGVLKENISLFNSTYSLVVPPQILVETKVLRIEEGNEVNWRISAQEEGEFQLNFRVNGKDTEKSLHVGGDLKPISRKSVQSSSGALFFNHSEKGLPPESPFLSVHVVYPDRVISLFGLDWHWLVWFFVFSLAFGFAFKGVLKVEV